MPLHDTSYKHWQGTHLSLWARRMVIARHGLASCLEIKGLLQLVMLCWIGGLIMSAVLFALGQLLVPDSIILLWVTNLNPDLQSFAQMLTTWLEQHPEISVGTAQNIIFYYFSVYLLRISIFIIAMVMPILITRDLGSNAIIMYASKAVSRSDYLLGKFSAIFGLITLTWLGPLCAAWMLGNLVGPDWHFFWHARTALGHLLLYGLIAASILGLLALGISASSNKDKATGGIWIVWWVVGMVIVPIASKTKPWLRHLSFSFNLDQIALAVFRPGRDIQVVQDNIPVLGDMLRGIQPETLDALNLPPVGGSVLALAMMGAIAAAIIFIRVKPE